MLVPQVLTVNIRSSDGLAQSLETKYLKWSLPRAKKQTKKLKSSCTHWSLTVARRPMLVKASSISRDVHMCWSDLRSILRFSLNAELTYKYIGLKCDWNGERGL